MLQLRDGSDNLINVGYRTEDHAGHGCIITAKICQHPFVWSEGEAAWNSRGKVKIRSIEKHSRMTHTVFSHASIFSCFPANFRIQEPIDIVVVARDTLSSSLQLTPTVPPSAQAVQNYNLVPEGATRVDSRHVAYGQIKVGKIDRDIRSDSYGSMRVQRRFRARLDLDRSRMYSFSSAIAVGYQSSKL
jgi:hypothetical protein